MFAKRLLALAFVLLFSHTVSAQSGGLSDLSSRLASYANDLADSSYQSYSRSFRNNRSNIDAAMLAYQFSAAAQLFNRMVNDRRPIQELRDAFLVLQNLTRSFERSNPERNRWRNIQQTMAEISRELSYSGDGPYPAPVPQPLPSGGRMTWKGRVDDDVRVIVRGGLSDVETIGGTPYYNATPNFTAALPRGRVTVRLNVRKGRGEVFIEQQPSRENDFACVVRIRDPKGGASDYEFELSW